MKAEMKTIEINGVEYVRADSVEKAKVDLSKVVLVRTCSAGVHIGEIADRNGKEVLLANSRRLYYWDGACSLSQVAMDGVNKNSKISVIVPEITLTEAIEIIPMSKKAAKQMMEAPEWKK